MAGIQNSGSQGYAVASIGIEHVDFTSSVFEAGPVVKDAHRKPGYWHDDDAAAADDDEDDYDDDDDDDDDDDETSDCRNLRIIGGSQAWNYSQQLTARFQAWMIEKGNLGRGGSLSKWS